MVHHVQSPREDQVDQPLGLALIAGEILALGGLEVDGQRELIFRVPVLLPDQLARGLQVPARRLIGGGRLRSAGSHEVESCQLGPLGRADDEPASLVQVVDDVKDPLLGSGRTPAIEQQASDGQIAR